VFTLTVLRIALSAVPLRGFAGMVKRLCAGGFLVCSAMVVGAFESAQPQFPAVQREKLPEQAQQVLVSVAAGGPFLYEKDGTTFGNRERLLPSNKRGYYREYTVPTPGVSHRGARRVVCGGVQPRLPDACYYTHDHYASFRLIVN
jgi:guanyl-specific ribonuclease Sa